MGPCSARCDSASFSRAMRFRGRQRPLGGPGESLSPVRPTYVLSRWLFLRLLGLVYLIAFVSLAVQITGLVGEHGILPAGDFLARAHATYGGAAYRLLPTLCWLGAGDGALRLLAWGGAALSLLEIAGVAQAPVLLLLWALYLSLSVVGQVFLWFQWDALLLETGLVAILYAPARWLPSLEREPEPSGAMQWLVLWLLFRLMFLSGITKLASGDPTWRNLTALDYHFWTQPLPTWTAWYVNLLPSGAKKLMVVGTYLLEIGVPFLIFGARPARLAACAGMILMQLLIFGTWNYNFFNLLTMALALLLVDDAVWASVLPARLSQALQAAAPAAGALFHRLATTLLAVLLLAASSVKLWLSFFPYESLPRLIARPLVWVEPFRSVNSYGLFRVMTTERPEIVVEGSDDSQTWLAYDFRYKPGDPSRRPAFVEPHQPRLDWQMWFAALSRYDYTPWFQAFLARLLEGSPRVVALMGRNPFPDHPPKYARAQLYEYRFTTWRERRETGAWWSRTVVGAYSPVVTVGPAASVPCGLLLVPATEQPFGAGREARGVRHRKVEGVCD